jgi:glycosyltransferase involved in cell wall biosynthesis
MRIVFSSNVSWSIFNFRNSLLKAFLNNGNEIYTVANKDEYSEKLNNNNFNFTEIKFNNNNKNPFSDILLIIKYLKVYKKISPDVIFHNAVKPNIYGSIAASLLKIPVINNISGLGTVFIKKSISTYIVKLLYKYSQNRARQVFFQNSDDFNLFVTNNLIDKNKCKVINGSGSDIDYFSPTPKNKIFKNFQFLFVGRLLFDKGIREYIEAAKILKQECLNVDFNILGPFALNNSSSVNKKEFNTWTSLKIIKYLGVTNDVKKFLINTDCVVLPSYREGMSKALIEASLMGIPIITSDVPGCRDVIENNVTGFLCEVKNSKDLAKKMKQILSLKKDKLIKMKLKSRERGIRLFDDKLIIKEYEKAVENIFC